MCERNECADYPKRDGELLKGYAYDIAAYEGIRAWMCYRIFGNSYE